MVMRPTELERKFSRRTLLRQVASMATTLAMPRVSNAVSTPAALPGNPLFPLLGVCDPHVRVFDDFIYLYASHDAAPDNREFVTHDWLVWKSSDLVQWECASILVPEDTYYRRPSTQCWATDAARRNGKYYFYFSMGAQEIGVVVGDTATGPWRDPLGKALIPAGSVATEARDPGILQERDGTSYLIFGTFDFYIARLNEDMISLAETPRLIEIRDKQGPYGRGKTDDKPYMHRRGDLYYLSWGSYYAMSDSAYGPFETRGALIQADHVDPEFNDRTNFDHSMKDLAGVPPESRAIDYLNYDRHGSFFELHGQWYFICNEQLLPGYTSFFRTSVLSYVHYHDNGDIAPIDLRRIGVGRYDAHRGIDAADCFSIVGGEIREWRDEFAVHIKQREATLTFPNVQNLRPRQKISIEGLADHGAMMIEVRCGTSAAPVVGRVVIRPERPVVTTHLENFSERNNLILEVDGRHAEGWLRRVTFG
jgi:hypothetical protein